MGAGGGAGNSLPSILLTGHWSFPTITVLSHCRMCALHSYRNMLGQNPGFMVIVTWGIRGVSLTTRGLLLHKSPEGI